MIFRFFQLYDYIISQLTVFSTLDPQVKYGISLDNANSIRAFTQTLANDTDKYTNYLFSNMGYPEWLIYYASFVYKIFLYIHLWWTLQSSIRVYFTIDMRWKRGEKIRILSS